MVTDRGYKSEIMRPETQKVNLIGRKNRLKKRPKHQEDSITLVLTFHAVLNIVFNVLKGASACTKVTCAKSGVTQTSTYSFP